MLSSSNAVFIEVLRPVRRRSTGVTAGTELHWAFERSEFDAESCEGCKRVDDDSTPIASVVITVVGIGARLDHAVDVDWGEVSLSDSYSSRRWSNCVV